MKEVWIIVNVFDSTLNRRQSGEYYFGRGYVLPSIPDRSGYFGVNQPNDQEWSPYIADAKHYPDKEAAKEVVSAFKPNKKFMNMHVEIRSIFVKKD